MKKFNISKRVTALALCLIMVLGLIPIMPTVAAEQGADDTRVTDPVTLDSWKEFFGTSDSFTTEHAGLVWTDKSVTADASHFGYATKVESGEEKIALSGDKNSFLVSLSAMASTKKITGETGKPIDIMMVLDMNQSMHNGSQRTTETVEAMLDSVNETIRQLQERNVNNRVGVTIFYGGPNRLQSKAPSHKLLLPLGRYVHADNEYLSYTASDGKLQSIGVNTDVKNENGASIDDISYTVPDNAGGYTQQGILSAMEQFLSADTKVSDTATANQGESRLPVMLLMSDRAPTAATNDYSNINADAVMGNNHVSYRNPAETDFVTQLTAAYAKEMIAAHYEEKPVFYTLSLGTDVSYDVMDPSDTLGKNDYTPSRTISGYWDTLLRNNNVSITVTNSPNAYNLPSVSKNYTVYKTTVSGKAFPSSKTQQQYVDKAFEAETAADLSSAFASIVSELNLQSHIYPSQVTGDENLDGYVSFADKIGEYMSVTEMKGILLGERWYSGKELSKNFVTGGGVFGTVDNPTALGDELVWSIQQRLGLSNSEPVRTLLALAYQHGQLAYNGDGSYSNYFGWYSDNDGNYLGFWQDGVSNAPANAAFKNKTYLYLGELDGTDGTNPTNMMYATVILQEEIATGEETVIFEVPAALLPTVTYNGEIDNGMLTSLSRDGAEQPIRLVYEVSLDEGVDETTLIDVVDEDYITKNKNADGSVNFYTNQFEADGTVGGGKVNTYSHFHPYYENSQYYYTKNETIYADQSGTVYESDSAPVSNGVYYRQYEVYANEGGELRIETRYQQLTSDEINFAVPKGDSSWYIPNNTVNCKVGSYAVAKSENKTNTLENSGSFYLDVNSYNNADTDHRYLVGNTLGNNGKITVTPTTGIMLSTVVEDSDADLTDVSFVYTVSSEDLTSDSFKTVTCAADGDKTIGTVAFTDGKANITLKAEESVFILGLPEDAAFSVTLNAGEDFVLMKATVDNTDQQQTAATVIPQKEHISNVTFTVLPMIDGAIYSISDLTKDYDGDPVVLPNVDRFGEGAITVEFKQKDEPDSAYTATPPSKAGDYFVRVSVAEWQNVRATSVTKAFSIIDEIAPTGKITIDENNFWEKLFNKISFGLFFHDSKTATVTATDAESGVKSVEYYVANADLIDDASLTDAEAISALEAIVNESWATYDKEIALNKNAKNVIYVKITDNVGNITYINSEGIVLYSDAEAVTSSVTATYKAGADKDVTVELNGNTVDAITNGDDVLAGTDYSVSTDGTITLKASYLDTLNAGAYTFTVSYNPLGEAYVEEAGNDAPATTTFKVVIEKAEGKVFNINISDKTYDGTAVTAPTFDKLGNGAATIEYKVKGADDSTYTTTAPKNAGNYVVRVTAAEGTNYKAASATAEFTIDKVAITVTADAKSKAYGEGDPVLTWSITSGALISGEQLTGITISRVSGENVNTYAITVSQAEGANKNYDITFVGGTFTVSSKTVDATVVVNGAPFIYSGSKQEPEIVVKNGDTVIPANEYEVRYANNINAGTATVTVTDKDGGNYVVNGSTTFIINKADPVIGTVGVDGTVKDSTHPSEVNLTRTDTTVDGMLNLADGAMLANKSIYRWVFTPVDTDNYNVINGDVQIDVLDTVLPTAVIKVDTNEWKQFFNKITFGLFFKKTQEVTIAAVDNENGSGIKDIVYFVSNREYEADDLRYVEWKSYTEAFDIEPDGKFVIYAKVTDNDGNAVMINSVGVVLDKTAAVVSGITDGETYYGQLVFTVVDELAGVKSVVIDGNDKTQFEGQYVINGDNAEHTVTVTDKAGNVTEYKITVYKNYTVTFKADGEDVATVTVGHGNNALLPAVPVKEGYSGKWNSDGKNITEDTTITAVYSANSYKVSFDANGGEAIDPITVIFDEKYGTLPSSSVAGLSGGNKNWYLVDANGNVTETNIKNLTLVSTAREHKLFIKRNVLSPNVSIKLTVPGGISDGYQYYIPGASQRVLTATVNNGNTELLSYTYQWYKDGDPIEGATASVLTLDGNVADSGTYKVEVTATLKDGTGIIVEASSRAGSKEQNVKILHATNTLSYDANGGEGGPQSSYTGGTSLNVSKDTPTKEHYDFIGWNTKVDGSGDSYKASDVYVFTEDGGNGGCVVTLYAQWRLVKHTVTYKADGAVVDTVTVEHGKDAVSPNVPKKDGYVGKWDRNNENITSDTVINAVYIEIDNVVPDEFKTDDKTDLEDAKKQLEDMLDDDSYTDDDKKDIQEAIDDIDDALEAIGNVEAVEELIDKLPDTIKKDDEAAIKAANDAYNALSDYEKSLVDKDAKKALDDAKVALAELNKPADSTSPDTGDNSNMFLWIALLFISGGAVITLTVVDRKKRTESK